MTKESDTKKNDSDALRSAIFCDQSVSSSQDDSDSDDEDRHKDLVPQNETSPTLKQLEYNTESGVELISEPDSAGCILKSPTIDETLSTGTPYRYVSL